MRLYVGLALCLFLVTPAAAQTAPETLAYLLFRISVPPKITLSYRIDITKSTPTVFQFTEFFTGYKNEVNVENYGATIEQTALCNFRVTGKLRNGDWMINLDNTLDFSAMSGEEPKFIVDKAKTNLLWDRYYYRIDGVKACTHKGSFKDKDYYYQFPAVDQCTDHIYTIFDIDNAGVKRLYAAYSYFKQTYCKGRAF